MGSILHVVVWKQKFKFKSQNKWPVALVIDNKDWHMNTYLAFDTLN